MPRPAALLVLLAAGACAPPPASSPPPLCVAPESTATAAPSPAPPPLPAAARSPRPGPCWQRGRPAPPPAPAAAPAREPFCASLDMTVVSAVEARLRRELTVQAPSRLVVDFLCYTAHSPIAEVWLEEGSGHGGSLRLVRIRRLPDGQADVRRMSFPRHGQGSAVEVTAGAMPWKPVGDALKQAHVAMLARLHVLRLHDPRARTSHLSFTSSSHDFHLRLSLVDQEGRVDDRRFTGYDGSKAQPVAVPLRMATEPLQRLLDGARLEPVAATDDDRTFFTRRLLDTLAHDPHWWVRERYTAAAAALGTVDAVPALAALTALEGGPSEERTRDGALRSIAALTGWDPRRSDDGAERTAEEAGREARRACALSEPAAPAPP